MKNNTEMLLVPVSMFLTGWLLDHIPTYSLFMGVGIIVGLVLLVAFRIKAIKDINNYAATTVQ